MLRNLTTKSSSPLTQILRASATPVNRTFSTTAVNMTISDAIKHDHRELETYYNNIKNAKDATEKNQWRNQFTWELARHSIAEELVVYPAFEKYLPDGKDMAEHDRSEHRTVKEYLKQVQDMDVSASGFDSQIDNLWANLSKHIKEEEEHDLPLMDQHVDKAEQDSLETSFGRTKMFIPTRSHPSAPDRPPFETVMGLMAAPMDKLGDLLRDFPDQKKV